ESQHQLPEAPISTGQFAKELNEATRAKLGRAPIPRLDILQLRAVVARALVVCAWEMRQMLNIPSAPGNLTELMETWMSHQSFSSRLRGWAYVVRQQGWLSSWRQWPRWLRMVMIASPRYWIYQAALQAAQRFTSDQATEDSFQYEMPFTLSIDGS